MTLQEMNSIAGSPTGSAAQGGSSGPQAPQQSPQDWATQYLGTPPAGIQNTPSATQPEQPGLLDQAAGLINKGYQDYTQLPGIKQLGEIGGAVGRIPGEIAGGAVAAIGNPIENAVEGKPLLQNEMSSIKQNAQATGNDTAQIGQQFGQAAPLAGLGEVAGPIGDVASVANKALAAGQGYQGVKDVGEGVKSGNAEQAVNGALELGTASGLGHDAIDSVIKGGQAIPEMVKNIPETIDNAKGALDKIAQAKVEKAYGDALNIPKNSKIGMSEADFGKNTPRVLTQEHVPIHLDDSGKLDLNEGLDQLKNTYNNEAQAVRKVDETSGLYHSLDQLRQDAISHAKSQLENSGTDLPEAVKYINSEFNALKDTYTKNGKGISFGKDILVQTADASDIKDSSWRKAFSSKLPTKEDAVTNSADYSIGNAIQDDIQNKSTDAKVKAMHQRLGDLNEAIKVMTDKNGKAPRRISMTRRALTVISGGIVGGVLGTVVGQTGAGGAIGAAITDRLAQGLSNRTIDVAAWNKIRDVLGRTQGGDDIMQHVQDTLNKRQALAVELSKPGRQLPAPAIQLNAPKARESRLYSQADAIQNLRSMGYKGPLTREEQGLSRLALPAPTTIQLPAPRGGESRQLSQEEAVRELRSMGYKGPLTREELDSSRPAPPAPKSIQSNEPTGGKGRMYSQEEAIRELKRLGFFH